MSIAFGNGVKIPLIGTSPVFFQSIQLPYLPSELDELEVATAWQ